MIESYVGIFLNSWALTLKPSRFPNLIFLVAVFESVSASSSILDVVGLFNFRHLMVSHCCSVCMCLVINTKPLFMCLIATVKFIKEYVQSLPYLQWVFVYSLSFELFLSTTYKSSISYMSICKYFLPVFAFSFL